MGKRTVKNHAHRKFDFVEKSQLCSVRDSFPDESNDSGHGSDASLLVPESRNLTYAESDIECSSDSLDLAVSRSPVSRTKVVTGTVCSSPHSNSRLSTSPKDKMLVKSLNVDNRRCVSVVRSLAEPSAKRRKVVENGAGSEKCNSLPCHPVLQQLASSVVRNVVLTEGVGRNSSLVRRLSDDVKKRVGDLDNEEEMSWSSCENLVPQSGSGHVVRVVRDERNIASLLSTGTHSLTSNNRTLKRPSLHICFPPRSKNGKVELSIVIQPEEQHRARYMTEGSRGSIKDGKGTGFPTVKLCGYNQPVTLQVFIGSDMGKVQPHLFYQSCKVTGKNCTPCAERVIEGTSVIEINMTPESDMTVSCDCIGILKERNVDVEQRLPYFGLTRCKKRSTRCRMVFRVSLSSPNGTVETLQIASSQIVCTQSPGLPEICKKSLTECSVLGGADLFVIGKNFQKDAKVVFQEMAKEGGADESNGKTVVWESVVYPEKEYLHQSHLICVVPPYRDTGTEGDVSVYLSVLSGGKSSEPHTFTYTATRPVLTDKFSTHSSPVHINLPSSSSDVEKNGTPSPKIVSVCGSCGDPDIVLGVASGSGLLSPAAGLSIGPSLHGSLPSSSAVMHLKTERAGSSSTAVPFSSPLMDVRSLHEFPTSMDSSCLPLGDNSSSHQVIKKDVSLTSAHDSVLSQALNSPILMPSEDAIQHPMLSVPPHSSENRPVHEDQLSAGHVVEDLMPPMSLEHGFADCPSSVQQMGVGHAVDFMLKIDQMATEMSRAHTESQPVCDLVGTLSSSLAATFTSPVDVMAGCCDGIRARHLDAAMPTSHLPDAANVDDSMMSVVVGSRRGHEPSMDGNANGNVAFLADLRSHKSEDTMTSFVSNLQSLSSREVHVSAEMHPPLENGSFAVECSEDKQGSVSSTLDLTGYHHEGPICAQLDVESHSVEPAVEHRSTADERLRVNAGSVPGGGSHADGATAGTDIDNVSTASYTGQCFCEVTYDSARESSPSHAIRDGEQQHQRLLSCDPLSVTDAIYANESVAATSAASVPTAVIAAAGPSPVVKSDKQDVSSMTLALSQLSDADLLSMINPSTFDTV